MRRLARPTGLSSRGFTQPQQPQQPQQQRQQQPHPHPHPQSPPQKQQRRHISSKRKPLSNYPKGVPLYEGRGQLKRFFPVFELPDIVLDLDAEDSPHVRPFDAHKDDPLQESRWGYDPLVDEVGKEARLMKQSMRKDLGKLMSTSQVPFSGTRLSDLDMMAVALMDQSTNVSSDNTSPAHKLDTNTRRANKLQLDLDRNGIPKAIGRDATKIIPFMLRRKQLALEALKDPSKRGPLGGDDEQDLNNGIACCKDLAELKRLCSRIDRPESGVEFSAASIDHVHIRLLEFLRSRKEPASSADVLKFVNNLTISRLSANKELNRSMTLFGLQLASDIGLLSCILQYLHICLSTGFIASRTESVTLTRSQVGNALLVALQHGEGTARGTRQQIFTLLTGRELDSRAQMPCLFGLSAEDQENRPEVFKLNISLLGELGALRLVAHHWRQRAKQMGAARQPLGDGRQFPQGMDETDDDVFVDAFLRCAQILGGVKSEETSVDLTTITGDIEKDAGLDVKNINAVDVIHAKKGTEIPKPSLSFIQSYSVEDIKDAFNRPDMRTSMSRFRKLIENAAETAPAT